MHQAWVVCFTNKQAPFFFNLKNLTNCCYKHDGISRCSTSKILEYNKSLENYQYSPSKQELEGSIPLQLEVSFSLFPPRLFSRFIKFCRYKLLQIFKQHFLVRNGEYISTNVTPNKAIGKLKLSCVAEIGPFSYRHVEVSRSSPQLPSNSSVQDTSPRGGWRRGWYRTSASHNS